MVIGQGLTTPDHGSLRGERLDKYVVLFMLLLATDRVDTLTDDIKPHMRNTNSWLASLTFNLHLSDGYRSCAKSM